MVASCAADVTAPDGVLSIWNRRGDARGPSQQAFGGPGGPGRPVI